MVRTQYADDGLRDSFRSLEAGKPHSRIHITALDGVRGIAFLWVFAFHALSGRDVSKIHSPIAAFLLRVASYGWLGVDLFFVLSGFLITGILIDSRLSEHYYRNFYIRRGLRIFPVYYLAVFAFLVVQPAWFAHIGPPLHYPWKVQIWYWLNLSNLITAFNPYLVLPLIHFWSLAIEEQFYLLWPWIIRRLPPKAVLGLCCCTLVLAECGRNLPLVVSITKHHFDFTYRFTPFHVDGLVCGAILAILLRDRGTLPRISRMLRIIGCCTFMIVLLVFHFASSRTTTIFVQRWPSLLAGLMFGSLLGLLIISGSDSIWSRALSWPVLRWVGALSYCLYVVHLACLAWGTEIAARLWNGGRYEVMIGGPLIALLLCFILATFSRIMIERPALRLKRRFR